LETNSTKAAMLQGQPVKKVLVLAMRAGEIMLSSGAETSRVEQTVNFIVKAYGFPQSQMIATPTTIYLSIDSEDISQPHTLVKRIHRRSLNFSAIAAVNDLSRRIVNGMVSLEEANREMEAISRAPALYPFWLQLLAGTGVIAGATLLLGAGVLDIIPALASAVLIQLVRLLLEKYRIPAIFGDFLGAALTTVIAQGLAWLGLPIHTSLVVAGSIISLVPGAALVASVQDGISGDLISSGARGLETLLKAAAIASGVLLALNAALALHILAAPGNTEVAAWQIPIQVGAAFVAAACHGVASFMPRYAILTAGLTGGCGWLIYLTIDRWSSAALIATFMAAFAVGGLGWALAHWQHSPTTLYILPGIFPLLPGLTIYQGMLQLAQNQNTEGTLLLVQALFSGGALAAGVALSNSLMPVMWRSRRKPKKPESNKA
jgi:uncharacterized membrane protein YjjP (DUF1212 family)